MSTIQSNSGHIMSIHQDSFRVNLYTVTHFRMIGLIDVTIQYGTSIERLTLAFYSSSGTNNGKIKGLWYPIVGIKTESGAFTEFTPYLNKVLTYTTRKGSAKKGWLAKSLFFYGKLTDDTQLSGFSNSTYYSSLLEIGNLLRDLYEVGKFHNLSTLSPAFLNHALLSEAIYPGNHYSQQVNYEHFIRDVFNQCI